MASHPRVLAPLLLVLACGDSGRADADGSTGGASVTFPTTMTMTTPPGPTTGGPDATSDGTAVGVDDTAAPGESGFKFDIGDDVDLGDSESGVPVPTCKVVDDMDAVQPCVDKAPPDSYDPEVQWTWTGDNGEVQAFSIPLVANLTDDNGDGAIDLCDTPDIIIQSFVTYGQWSGSLYAVDGATGQNHWKAPVVVDTTITPALGDIDADGIPEIVAFDAGSQRLVALEHDGTLKWTANAGWPDYTYGAIGMADLDNDGYVV